MIRLDAFRKNEELRTEYIELLKNEYLESFMTMSQFCQKYEISYNSVKFLLGFANLKKDESKYNPSKRPEVVSKIANTKLERYGNSKYNNPEKNRITCLEKYGVEHPRQNQEINQKGISTFENRFQSEEDRFKFFSNITEKRNKTIHSSDYNYGEKVRSTRDQHTKEDFNFLESIQAKRKETTLNRFGVDNISKSEDVKSKKEKHCLEKYGTKCYTQTAEYRIKSKETQLRKYGVDSYSKTKEFASKRNRKWIVDDLWFDSKWEVYYYFYLEDLKIPFETQIPLSYIYNNTECKYFCDFKRLDTGELIEIKNPAMIDSNGDLKILYKCKGSSEKNRELEEKLECKNNCIKEYNVTILHDAGFFNSLKEQFEINHPDKKIRRSFKNENSN